MTKDKITDKEWLDLAWKHFQQHAQQRILYFNYFVVFSTILTTGLVTTFQSNFHAPFLGIGIGLIQSYLSFLFWKIDERNRFITKHAENTIKMIEEKYELNGDTTYKLFINEEIETKLKEETDKSNCILFRQISHGKSYKIMFTTFFIIGILGSVICSIYSFKENNNDIQNPKVDLMIKMKIEKIDKQNSDIVYQFNSFKISFEEINTIKIKLDSLQQKINKLSNQIHTHK